MIQPSFNDPTYQKISRQKVPQILPQFTPHQEISIIASSVQYKVIVKYLKESFRSALMTKDMVSTRHIIRLKQNDLSVVMTNTNEQDIIYIGSDPEMGGLLETTVVNTSTYNLISDDSASDFMTPPRVADGTAK
ncbi:hypothetical protein ACFE04_000036 [Oxalis oulophora]